MTYVQTWTKHLREQLLNDKRYDERDYTVLSELFFMLMAAIEDKDSEAYDAYYYVIRDFLLRTQWDMFDKILVDSVEERDELLQEEPHAQTKEGEGEL